MKPKFTIWLATGMLLISLNARSQGVGIAPGEITPAISAILELRTTGQGFLPPRMTTAQRNTIVAPAMGLMVYDSNLKTIMLYNGTAWDAVSTGIGAGPWALNGNNIYNINSGNVGIGTNEPGYKLAVEGDAAVFTAIKTNQPNGSANIMLNALTGQTVLRRFGSTSIGTIFGLQQASLTQITSDGGFAYGSTGNSPLYFASNNIIRLQIAGDGNVGIGTGSNAPTAKLEVVGQVKITGGIPGLGKVLTSDANGLAAWAKPALSLPVEAATTGNYAMAFSITNPTSSAIAGYAGTNSGATGVVGVTQAENDGVGVRGRAEATAGNSIGVAGTAAGDASVGVLGEATSSSGFNYGVQGLSTSETGVGVYGFARSGFGVTTGVSGNVASSGGFGGYFNNNANGIALKTGRGFVTFDFMRGEGNRMVIADANGNLGTQPIATSQWASGSNNIYNTNIGGVGIGTDVPYALLHVYKDEDVWHTFTGGASGRLQFGGQAGNGGVIQSWNPQTNTARDLYLQRDGGNVGIGTTTPGAKLEVAGQIKITGGSPGAGKILVSDGQGLASWQNATGGTADNWGSQVAKTNTTLTGNGTTAQPLGLAPQGATTGQVLKFNGTTWAPGNDVSAGVIADATLVGGGVTGNPLKIAAQGAQPGQVLKYNGTTWLPANALQLPFSGAANTTQELFTIVNNGSGKGINVVTGAGDAVNASTTTGIALRGSSSSSGTGVSGATGTGTAGNFVATTTGTALNAYSVSGTALNADGVIKLKTTGVAAGKYLQAVDANGTVQWVNAPTGGGGSGWGLTGNSGTDNATNFIGTTDEKNVVFRQNNEVALTIRGGGSLVATGNTTTGATPAIGPGARMMWIPNRHAFRSGEVNNFATWSEINIGYNSSAFGFNSNAAGYAAFAAGNNANAGASASIALGTDATSGGSYSVAIGTNVYSQHLGSVVFGDYDISNTLVSSNSNQMSARFSNGYMFYTNTNHSIGARLDGNDNMWKVTSDSTRKENFKLVNTEDFLQKISGFNLRSWNYKGQDAKLYRHYGPMAQEFYKAFGNDGIGIIGNDTTINMADFSAINMIAIQALEKRTGVLKDENARLKANNDALLKEIAQLKQQMSQQTADVTKKLQALEKLVMQQVNQSAVATGK